MDFGTGRWRLRFGRGLMAMGVALGLALLGPAEVSSRQADARRIALVITNNSAGPDIAAGGEAVSQKLTALGYQVVAATNAGSTTLYRNLGQIEGQADENTIVVIYYAGFGVRANGRDYLVPAGQTPASAADLAASALDLDDTTQRLRAKGAVVAVFLDACPQSMMLNALGGVCAGDPSRSARDVYLVSAASRMRLGDLTAQLPRLLKEGRTVAEVFTDVESALGGTAVVQAQTPASPRAASVTFARTAAAPPRPVTPAPAPVQPVAPQPQPVAPAAPAAPADGVDMVTFLTGLLDLTDAAEVQKARARATEFGARYGDLAGADDRSRYTVEATLAYVNGDYEKALRAIEAIRAAESAQNLPALSGNQERRRNRLEGSIYLRLGRAQLAIPRLEAEEKSYLGLGDASKAGPVWTRLGEAYRLAGRRTEARDMLRKAAQVQSAGGKGLAMLQLSLLSYDEGAYQDAADTANTVIDILNGPPAMSGLADAYIAFAKARFKLRPRDEGEAWLYVDMAREIDRRSAAAAAFEAELPVRQSAPTFASMRPTFSFKRDIESRALACYDTPEARAAYLATITAESNAAGEYLSDINAYVQRLTRQIESYDSRGYLENFEGSLKGRGYPYRSQIIAEQNAWTGARWNEVSGRISALTEWYNIAMRAEVPCSGEPGSRMPAPSTYRPRIPSDSFSGAGLTTPLASAAPAPSAAPPRIIAPPQAAASAPAPVITAPPPAPRPVTLAAAPPPPAVVSAPPPTVAPPKPAPASPPPEVAPPKPQVQAAAPSPAPAGQTEARPAPPPQPAPDTPAPKPVQTAAAPPPAAAPTTRPAAGAMPQLDFGPAKPAASPPATTVASAPPPKVTPPAVVPPPAPKPVTPPPATVAAPPPAVAKPVVQAAAPSPAPVAPTPAPASTASGSLVAPPPIVLALAPATPPAASPVAAPAVKGKPPAKPAAPPTTGPGAAKAAIDRAGVLLAQGRYEQAQREYAAASTADPASNEAQAGVIAARGLGKLQAGQTQPAVDDLLASLNIHPLPEAYEGLGRIYAANATRGPAIEMFSKAIALRPTYAQAYLGRAEARRERATPLRDTAELQQAVEDYRAVLVAKSDLPEALFGLGVARFALNDYAGAVESFDGALLARPIFVDARYARARARFELAQYQEALKDLVDLPPSFDVYARSCSTGMAFVALADAALAAKDEPRAIELFTQASQAFAPALAAKPNEQRIKFWAQLTNQNAIPGLGGKGIRGMYRVRMEFAPGKVRPAPAPTATLAYVDACRRAF